MRERPDLSSPDWWRGLSGGLWYGDPTIQLGAIRSCIVSGNQRYQRETQVTRAEQRAEREKQPFDWSCCIETAKPLESWQGHKNENTTDRKKKRLEKNEAERKKGD